MGPRPDRRGPRPARPGARRGRPWPVRGAGRDRRAADRDPIDWPAVVALYDPCWRRPARRRGAEPRGGRRRGRRRRARLWRSSTRSTSTATATCTPRGPSCCAASATSRPPGAYDRALAFTTTEAERRFLARRGGRERGGGGVGSGGTRRVGIASVGVRGVHDDAHRHRRGHDQRRARRLGTGGLAAARLPADARHVAPGGPALAREHTVVAPDLRGYGDASRPPAGADHAGYAFRGWPPTRWRSCASSATSASPWSGTTGAPASRTGWRSTTPTPSRGSRCSTWCPPCTSTRTSTEPWPRPTTIGSSSSSPPRSRSS